MHWLILFAAAGCEVVWAVALKASDSFRRPGIGVFAVAVNIVSVVLLAKAMQKLPLGTSYAVWTGIGAVGTAIVGMVVWNEPRSAARIACIALIILGMVGLEVFGDAGRAEGADGHGGRPAAGEAPAARP